MKHLGKEVVKSQSEDWTWEPVVFHVEQRAHGTIPDFVRFFFDREIPVFPRDLPLIFVPERDRTCPICGHR